MFFKYALLIIVSYLIGNISFARLLSRLKKDDITRRGSGNPGTFNMLRNYGIKYGLLTLLLDVLKGVLPALFGYYLFGGALGTPDSIVAMYAGGVSVIVGHIFPVFYKFKGGKGIACTLGVFFVANPLWMTLFFFVPFVYVWFFDYGSIASFICVTALVLVGAFQHQGNLAISILLFLIFSLTWFAHRQNIFRLLIGKENKANLKSALTKLKNKKKDKNID